MVLSSRYCIRKHLSLSHLNSFCQNNLKTFKTNSKTKCYENNTYMFSISGKYQTPRSTIRFNNFFLFFLLKIVATASLLSIMIPKMNILCDTISHITFMFCAYIFFCSCLQVCVEFSGYSFNKLKLS